LNNNFTFLFLTRKNNRDLLGSFWQDKSVHDRSKRGLLQSIGYRLQAFFRALVTKFYATFDIYLAKEEITTFFGPRPDGVVFNEKDKECVFLEFTRLMDSTPCHPLTTEADRTEEK